jgi:selenocysteine-specific elongation factor
MGTAEVMASVLLLEGDRLQRGESAMAQLFLSEVAVASWNQAFVIRSESPMVTIGGGRVLVACAEKIRRAGPRQLQALNDLLSGEPVVRAGAAAYFAGFRPWSASDLERTAGIHGAEQDQVCRLLIERGDLVELQVSAHRTVRWHRLVLDQLQQRIESVLKRMHDHEPLATFVESSRVAHQLAFWVDTATLDVVMAEMQRSGTIRLTPKGVGLAGHGPKLSQSEQKLLAELVERYRRAGFQPPTVRECQQQANKNQQSVASLLALAAAEGDLVAVSADFFLHVDAEARLRAVLRAAFEERGGLTLSEIRELLNTTRKYAVPTCEYLDRIGFTRREGDLRWLAAEPNAREAPPTETQRAHG